LTFGVFIISAMVPSPDHWAVTRRPISSNRMRVAQASPPML
jgi:hypothetical protein